MDEKEAFCNLIYDYWRGDWNTSNPQHRNYRVGEHLLSIQELCSRVAGLDEEMPDYFAKLLIKAMSGDQRMIETLCAEGTYAIAAQCLSSLMVGAWPDE